MTASTIEELLTDTSKIFNIRDAGFPPDNCPEVRLSRDELQRAARLGRKRHKDATALRKYDKVERNPLQTHIFGMSGELAVFKYLGVDPSDESLTGQYSQPDLKLKDGTLLQIKTRSRHGYNLYMSRDAWDRMPTEWTLFLVTAGFGGTYYMRGYLPVREAIAHLIFARPGMAELPASHLYPASDLLAQPGAMAA